MAISSSQREVQQSRTEGGAGARRCSHHHARQPSLSPLTSHRSPFTVHPHPHRSPSHLSPSAPTLHPSPSPSPMSRFHAMGLRICSHHHARQHREWQQCWAGERLVCPLLKEKDLRTCDHVRSHQSHASQHVSPLELWRPPCGGAEGRYSWWFIACVHVSAYL